MIFMMFTQIACRPEPVVEAQPPAPMPELAPEPSAPPARAEADAMLPGAPRDAAALLALLEGETTPVVNDLSGDVVGQSVERAAAGDVAGVPCAAIVTAWDEAWGCALTREWSHGGYTLAAGESATLHYGSGRHAGLSIGALVPSREAEVFGGVPCARYVRFHPDGSVWRCTLSAAHGFAAGVVLPVGSEVTLRPDGTVESAFVHEDLTVAGKRVPAGHVGFDASGAVSGTSPGYFGD
ncbi:MAG: hypothetical protein H6737_21355 [Alphaproteobacteria bacterium]|nr:hypothetical protein [Alphaproteobacteria bacterium]